MSKKKILKNKDSVEVNIKELSFSDLYSMYSFVNNLNNTSFGKKEDLKKLFRDKLKDVEGELYNRTFGKNPFVQEKAEPNTESKEVVSTSEIVGQNPIDVISSFPEVVETFVVKK